MQEENRVEVSPAADAEEAARLTGERAVRREKLSALRQAGKDPFRITKYDVTHHSGEIRENYDSLEGKEVSVAGRLMSKRVMGKASFCHLLDREGSIQCYVARDFVGEESYSDFKRFDIGDIVGICGTVFKTGVTKL